MKEEDIKWVNAFLRALNRPKQETKIKKFVYPTQTIRNISDYLRILERDDVKLLQIDNFRGEARNYGIERITASSLRRSSSGSDHFMQQEFYKQTNSRLSNNEIKYFHAFCQHHRIPTNLIDITTNPLTALYFACDQYADKNGYVYGFRFLYKQLDITEFIDDYDVGSTHKKSSHDMITDISYLCCNHEFNRAICIWLNALISDKAFKKTDEEKIKINEIIEIIKQANIIDRMNDDDLNYLFTILPVATYKPLINFDRAISQQSKFIFQWHEERIKNTIKPDIIFRIPFQYKKALIHELDSLNINRATVYQDFDNIAEYIKEKYSFN
jgi:hypothetical protein